ncbi:MAG: MFS transporter [Acidimicrobiales bacterium]
MVAGSAAGGTGGTGGTAPGQAREPARSAGRSRGERWRGVLLPAWGNRDLNVILIARGTMSAARAIAGVVTALYLAAVGFSAVEIGVLFLFVTIASAVLSTVIGMASDRIGRKPFLIGIPLLAAVAGVVYGVSDTPVVLFVFAALGSFGRGAGAGGGTVGPYQPAESAMVADQVAPSFRAAAFGRLAFMSSLGALAGGLLAGLASTHSHLRAAQAMAAYRPAFLAAAGLSLVAGLVALALHDSKGTIDRARETGRRRAGGSPARNRWPRRSWPALWRLWITNSVNGLAMGLTGPFVSYWLYRRYGAGPGEIGLLFAVVNLGSLVSTLAAAGIGRRLGTVRAIVAVRAFAGVLLIPMVLAPTFWWAGVLYFVRMLAQRVGLPLRQSFTQDVADPEERASLAALSNVPAQGTMAFSQVLAGYLFDDIGLAAPFELGAVLQLVNAIVYGVLFGRWQPHLSGERPAAANTAPAPAANTAPAPAANTAPAPAANTAPAPAAPILGAAEPSEGAARADPAVWNPSRVGPGAAEPAGPAARLRTGPAVAEPVRAAGDVDR